MFFWNSLAFLIAKLKDLYQIIMYTHWGGPGTLLYCCTVVS